METEDLGAWLEAHRRRCQGMSSRMTDAKPLAESLAALAAQPWFSRRYEMKDILAAWAAAAGPSAAEHSEPRGVSKGVLSVMVDSAACLQELANFRKKEILASLAGQPACGKIHDVAFRLGSLERDK